MGDTTVPQFSSTFFRMKPRDWARDHWVKAQEKAEYGEELEPSPSSRSFIKSWICIAEEGPPALVPVELRVQFVDMNIDLQFPKYVLEPHPKSQSVPVEGSLSAWSKLNLHLEELRPHIPLSANCFVFAYPHKFGETASGASSLLQNGAWMYFKEYEGSSACQSCSTALVVLNNASSAPEQGRGIVLRCYCFLSHALLADALVQRILPIPSCCGADTGERCVGVWDLCSRSECHRQQNSVWPRCPKFVFVQRLQSSGGKQTTLHTPESAEKDKCDLQCCCFFVDNAMDCKPAKCVSVPLIWLICSCSLRNWGHQRLCLVV